MSLYDRDYFFLFTYTVHLTEDYLDWYTLLLNSTQVARCGLFCNYVNKIIYHYSNDYSPSTIRYTKWEKSDNDLVLCGSLKTLTLINMYIAWCNVGRKCPISFFKVLKTLPKTWSIVIILTVIWKFFLCFCSEYTFVSQKGRKFVRNKVLT